MFEMFEIVEVFDPPPPVGGAKSGVPVGRGLKARAIPVANNLISSYRQQHFSALGDQSIAK